MPVVSSPDDGANWPRVAAGHTSGRPWQRCETRGDVPGTQITCLV